MRGGVDGGQEVYVDRDWWLFRYVLTFLRDGLVPQSRSLALQLYREAAFWRLTGVPMVLNTSFNGRDEAIVATEEQAIESALRLGLDGLVLGTCYVDLPGSAR